MKFGDQIPTGTYLDMAANLPLVDPKKVLSPVLMIRGEHDGNSTNEDLLDFYRQLPNGDRQFVILPHTAHSPGYSNNRHLLWYAVKNFLAAPAPVASEPERATHSALQAIYVAFRACGRELRSSRE